jgi:hypothetical protein
MIQCGAWVGLEAQSVGNRLEADFGILSNSDLLGWTLFQGSRQSSGQTSLSSQRGISLFTQYLLGLEKCPSYLLIFYATFYVLIYVLPPGTNLLVSFALVKVWIIVHIDISMGEKQVLESPILLSCWYPCKVCQFCSVFLRTNLQFH